ncbi:hypothetical protein GOODEAATRI_011996 [Goodea atripinnis]|uniref:Uncharacterized protein n=1 Tax=Goodea atripinnis TaxID=208336 RepID=A0ABV0PDD4_9TELE
MKNSCPDDRLSHLCCESLLLLQSYHGPLGCFSLLGLSTKVDGYVGLQMCNTLFLFSDYGLASHYMVVQLVALLLCSEKVPGSTSSLGSSAWSLHVLPVQVWVFSGYTGFLPKLKNTTANWSL